MSETLLDHLAGEIEGILAPLASAAEDPFWFDRLFAQLGISPDDESADAVVTALKGVVELKDQATALAADPSPSLDGMAQLLKSASDTFTAVRALSADEGAAAAFPGLGEDLIQLLLGIHVATKYPLLYQIAKILTLIDPAEVVTPTAPVIAGDSIRRAPVVFPRFRLERLLPLLRDPVPLLRAEYVNSLTTVDEANAMADKLFPRIAAVLTALGVPNLYGIREASRPLLGVASPLVDHALLVYIQNRSDGATDDAGISLVLSSADRGDLGLVFCPFGTLTFAKEVEDWAVEFDFAAEVDAFAYGHQGVTLAPSAATTHIAARVSATLDAPDNGPAFIFGAPTGSRLEVGGAQLKLETSLSEARQSLALSADVSSSAIVIAPGDGDGFLRSILPAEGIRAEFDLGLAWSNTRGLTLRGSAGLDATLPVGISVGGVLTVPTIHLSLLAREAGLTAEILVSVGVSIGPVHATIDRVGIATVITFPETGGNLGVADLDLGFKPPNGLVLTIDAPTVIGGGSLRFDPQKEEYSGNLELQIAETIAVKAIGLLTTRLPDGAKGYSLVVIIFVEDFKPIQLGLGFALTSIGGLLAINRTFDEAALRAGLKNHTLDSILFPQDPIRNAPQILSNLNKVFPPANGHHLFGPMAQIAWGTPPLITADLALVLEFGARLRLLILAQVVAILPKQENDLVCLQMDAIGVIDFDQGTAELDATLHDSRLLKKFVLTGDMAMRLKWEGSPNFALAIGGLHHAFNPPPNFPKLERIAINLCAGDNPRFRCEAYFALTSNTVQFGARAELYASASKFSIQGETGFDVLIQLDPFHFLADFHAQVQLKRGSTNLFKVRVDGALTGPRPLHIKAKVTFEILWWDYSIRIDKTLVEGELPPLPEPIDVLPRLKEALGNPGNWKGQLPENQRPMVTLRAKPKAPNEVLLHPLGTLTVKQGVVPLNLDISRFGQAAPAGARRFTIGSVSPGDQNQTIPSVKDFFAPAQFLEMSDDEKLSRPSFELMDAGVSIGSNEFDFSASDGLEVKAIAFETIIVDKQTNTSRHSDPADPRDPEGSKKFYTLSPELLGKQALFGAAGNSDLRRTGKAKYRATIASFKITEQSLMNLKTEGVPDDVLEKLQGIKNQEVRNEEGFLALLKTTIGDEQTVTFKSLIMKHATTIGKYRVAKEGWSVVATDNLTVQSVPGIEAGKPTAYSEAVQALRKLKQENPAQASGLKILRLSEIALRVESPGN